MAFWRNCKASMELLTAVNARWPSRSKASDGTIGDQRHQATKSDHNPNAAGVVRARDITADGVDAPWLAEHLRKLGAAGDRRLAGGGYVIFNRRITNPDFESWRPYKGSNPHTKHVHVSFARDARGYDSSGPWNLDPPKLGRPVLRRGSKGAAVALIQRFLGVTDTGDFDENTENAVKRYQRIRGLEVDGVVGPITWANTGL